MRTEQFLRDYFDKDENFIIALKTLPATKDKNIKIVGRGTVIRSIESDPRKNKEFNDLADRLADKFVMS